MIEMFGEAWSPMSVPDLAPDDDEDILGKYLFSNLSECVERPAKEKDIHVQKLHLRQIHNIWSTKLL